MKNGFFSLWIVSLLCGCPDPIESTTNTNTTEQDPGVMQQNGPSKMESDPNQARLNLKPGEGLTISGTIQYAGTATGSKRIDVQKFREGSAPSLVHTLEISDDNSFSFQVPPDYGKIIITGFIDKAGNGPTSDDPQGRLSIEIGKESQESIILEISDDYTPPAAPGGEKPPEGQPGQQPNQGQPGQQPNQGQAGQQPNQGQPGQQPNQGQPSGGVEPAAGQPGAQNNTPDPAKQGSPEAPKQQDGPPADDGQP